MKFDSSDYFFEQNTLLETIQKLIQVFKTICNFFKSTLTESQRNFLSEHDLRFKGSFNSKKTKNS